MTKKNKIVTQEIKEQMLLSQLLHNKDLFLKGITFLKPEFFTTPVNQIITSYITEYYDTYRQMPVPEIILMDLDDSHEIPENYLDIDEPWLNEYLEDKLNKFIQNMSMKLAIEVSIDLLPQEDYTTIETHIKDAVNVDLDVSLGLTINSDTESFNELFDIISSKEQNIPTGWSNYDEKLDGGVNIPSLNYIFAKSGGGKSVGLINLSKNYILQGRDVVYVSLELKEEKILKRYLSHFTQIKMFDLENNKSDLFIALKASQKRGDGRFTVQFFQPNTLNAKKLELFIKNYIHKYKNTPIIIVDYAGLMTPNGKNWQGMFEKDKYVSEELRGVATLFNTIIWTADQFNRCIFLKERVKTPYGYTTLETLQPNDKILGTNNEWRTVLHKTDVSEQEIYEITTKSGKKIKVSGNHIFPKYYKNKTIEDCINASLKVGDNIYIKDDD